MFMMEMSTGKIIDDAEAAPGMATEQHSMDFAALSEVPQLQLAVQSIIPALRATAATEHAGLHAAMAMAVSAKLVKPNLTPH